MSERSLVGREPERERLAELLHRVPGRGGVLALHGEAGSGKSALLADAGARATAVGMRLLTAVGMEAEQRLPYAGLHQLLYPVRAAVDALPGSQREAVRAAIGLTDRAVPDSHLIKLGTLHLLAEIATEAPALLVVDDAHWLDPASAEVLAFVARRLGSEPVVLLAALRNGAECLLGGAGLPSMAVGRLPQPASAMLLDSVAPGLDSATRQRLLDEAAGNPLALIELPKTVQVLDGAPLPALLPLSERLMRACTAGLVTLPAETRMALVVAALNDVAGVAETLEAVTAGLGHEIGGDALVPAVRAQVISVHNGLIAFRHPLTRSALAQSTSAQQRQRIHAVLAEVLRGQADRQAWHRAAATTGTDGVVAAELEAAADRAQRRGDVRAAVAALEHAARLSATPTDRAGRLLQAADLAIDWGERAVVGRLLDEMATLDLTPQQSARVAWIRSGCDDGVRADTTSPLELARLAESTAADGDTTLAARMLGSAAQRCFWSEPGALTRAHIGRAAEAMFADKWDPRLLTILAYASPIDRGARVIEGLRLLEQRPVGEQLDDRLLGTAALLVGAFDVAARLSAASAAALRSQRRSGLLAGVLAVQAWSSVRLGDLDTAAHAAEEGGRLARMTDQPHLFGIVRGSQAEIAALRGDYVMAERFAAEAERASVAAGIRPVLAAVQIVRGQAALGEARFADAFAHLRRVHDPADPAFQTALRCFCVPELVEAAMRSGHTQEVVDIVGELETLPLSDASPALGMGLRYARALLAGDEEAEVCFKTALHEELCGWPLQRARLQLAFGEWLRRQRRATESRPHLRAARETFDALGMAPWSERAQNELRAAGDGCVPRADRAQDRLTAQELHVAQLAAEGLTNRQIGQRLYLSHRTVSTHLHRIFPKLSITSRAELGTVIRHC
jgi:DNA-binding CsgD family transcriptional regulator